MNNYAFIGTTVQRIAFVFFVLILSSAQADTDVVFGDDFEAYQSKTFPSSAGWSLKYSGASSQYQYIDNTYAVSGLQSLHLIGSSCWSATAIHEAKFPPHFTLEATVFVDQIVSCGCSSILAYVRPYNPDIGSWETAFEAVTFNCDGKIYAIQSNGDRSKDVLLLPYNPRTWYRVKMDVDLNKKSYDVYQAVPNWVKVTDKAGWQPRDSQGEVVYHDQLWIFGGWFNSYEAPPRDVWSSPDGQTWKRVTASAPWKHSDLPMTQVFQDKMWIMGGWYNGRLPGYSASNEVWWSTDGENWSQATANAGWSPRIAAATVVFQGKMWILGGTENYYFGDEKSLKNDVWYSQDGKEWTLATDHARWSPRAYLQAVVLNEKIYVMGGGNYVPQYHALHDVWSSADGVNWTKETEAAPWHPRLWFSAVTYRDRMWVLGGWSDNPSKNWGDVWYSKDGNKWLELKSPVTWKERHEHSALVWRDKIWVLGGNAQSLSSEVWSLDIPPDWFQGE